MSENATVPTQSPAPGAAAAPGQPGPVFVQPGVQPYVMPMSAASGTVFYYPQLPGGGGTGAILMPMPVQYSARAQEPKVYEYKPNDYYILSILTLISCGIFSPLTLTLSIPALLFSLKSSKHAKKGAIKVARQQGLVAAYLNLTAIIFALIVACVATGLTIGLYADDYALLTCINNVKAANGGMLPTPGYVGGRIVTYNNYNC